MLRERREGHNKAAKDFMACETATLDTAFAVSGCGRFGGIDEDVGFYVAIWNLHGGRSTSGQGNAEDFEACSQAGFRDESRRYKTK